MGSDFKVFIAVLFTQFFVEFHANLIFRETGKIFGKNRGNLHKIGGKGKIHVHTKNRAESRIHAINQSGKFFQFTHSRGLCDPSEIYTSWKYTYHKKKSKKITMSFCVGSRWKSHFQLLFVCKNLILMCEHLQY